MNLDEALANIPLVTVLCGGLYAAAYLSFVRLLRFPRNWTSPGLSESLATAALAIITVALVSLSAGGLDLPALIVSSGFFGLLFFIIAAPAIVFQPAPRLVEFLARHGD